jgi:hypothetical protein
MAGGAFVAVGFGVMWDSVPVALVAIGITLAVAGAGWAIGGPCGEE